MTWRITNLLNPITIPVSLTVPAIPKPVITAVGNAGQMGYTG